MGKESLVRRMVGKGRGREGEDKQESRHQCRGDWNKRKKEDVCFCEDLDKKNKEKKEKKKTHN